jgi:hypothetical protein
VPASASGAPRNSAHTQTAGGAVLSGPRRYEDARQPVVHGRSLSGVAYGTDVADVIAGDVEGEDGDGGAVVLGNQAGLAVDSAFEDGQGCSQAAKWPPRSSLL